MKHSLTLQILPFGAKLRRSFIRRFSERFSYIDIALNSDGSITFTTDYIEGLHSILKAYTEFRNVMGNDDDTDVDDAADE